MEGRGRIIILIAILAGALITAAYGFAELKFLKIREYEIKNCNVPVSLNGKKIALLSDLHGIEHGKDNCRLIEKIRSASPDIIVISGDLINGRDDSELKYAFRFIRAMKHMRIPVIYTFGNHEEKLKKSHYRSYRRLRRFARRRIMLLNNRAVSLKGYEDVVFVGLNLPLYMYHDHDKGIIKYRTDKILEKHGAKDCYKILIAHDPEHFKSYAENGYDICLSGHLHGGIVYLPLLGGAITPRFQMFKKIAKGIHRYKDMTMIVSGGIGWHDIPVRLFNHPEIVIIKFTKEERK